MESRLLQVSLIVFAAGCVSAAGEFTKGEARLMGGRAPDGRDLCAVEGWYGDGECDTFCPDEDADCAICPAYDAPEVRYVSTDPAECATIFFGCEEGEEGFSDHCGCGCVAAPSCPDPASPEVRYVSTDPAECALILFECEEGEDGFSDACGCGCVAAPSCPDPASPRVRYVREDPVECAALLYACEPGEEPFFSECGCGCIAEDVCALETRLEVVGGWWVGAGVQVRECADVTFTSFGEAVCSRPLPDDAEIGPSDVRAALEHPDVAAALASGLPLYGIDASPVDGPLLEIERDGRRTRVGSPCDERGACEPIPPGLQALFDLAFALIDQEGRREECR